MRVPLVLALLALTGCPSPTSYPLQICSANDDPCLGEFECVGFHCVADCRYEGDCDPGFRCVNQQCLQSCDATDDCTIGVCGAIGDGRDGSACELRNLPNCATDDHCGWGVCVDGACLGRCDWQGECGIGQVCDFRRGEYGTCVTDPDYVPPPPPSTCLDKLDPDTFCRVQLDIDGAFCEAGNCVRRYAAAVVFDNSEPESCEAENDSPGTDLIWLNLVGGAATTIPYYEAGLGDGNTHTDPTIVETAPITSCLEEDAWLSLGCGGGAVFASDQWIGAGWQVEVFTRSNACLEEPESAASVYLCDSWPNGVTAARSVCNVYLGPTTSSVLTVPY